MRWKVLKSKDIFKSRFFRLRVDECELPDGRIMPDYYVMEFVDWVNVVALTESGQMVMVEQYRHGGDDIFLEVPGGSTNMRGEDTQLAGLRELLEETGYAPQETLYLGYHYPNPALQTNRMHTYLALGCRKVQEPELDPFEDLKTVLLPAQEVMDKWMSGEIKHSIIASSLGLAYKPLRDRGLIS
ncbi:MAG: NUDIX hydrolase [Bdellovibrionales bacterium]|nr:NUDIX hydrolase [Bdellovibrionales bacterium]